MPQVHLSSDPPGDVEHHSEVTLDLKQTLCSARSRRVPIWLAGGARWTTTARTLPTEAAFLIRWEGAASIE